MTINPSDDELLALIAEQQRKLPPRLVDDAKALFSWRTVDEQLVELLSDSIHDMSAEVRSVESSVRHIEFGIGDRRLHIDHLVDQQLVTGRLVDLDAGEVVAEWADGVSERVVVADGRFEVAVRTGSVRFAMIGPGEASLISEWVTLG